MKIEDRLERLEKTVEKIVGAARTIPSSLKTEKDLRREIKILRDTLNPLERLEQRDYMERVGEICELRGRIKSLQWVLGED